MILRGRVLSATHKRSAPGTPEADAYDYWTVNVLDEDGPGEIVTAKIADEYGHPPTKGEMIAVTVTNRAYKDRREGARLSTTILGAADTVDTAA